MSSCTADRFGIESEDEVGCIGRTSESFKTCILEVYYNEEKWTKLSSNEIDFIRRTHSREKVMSKWRHILDKGLNLIKRNGKRLNGHIKQYGLSTNKYFPNKECSEGEEHYRNKYPDVDEALKEGIFETGFEHWTKFGRVEGNSYFCNIERKSNVDNGRIICFQSNCAKITRVA